MIKYADDGFGNLVSLKNPYGAKTIVRQRAGEQVAHYAVETGDINEAISTVRATFPNAGAAVVLVNGGRGNR